MSRLGRSFSIFALLLAIGVTDANAQNALGSDNFRWYLGGQAGAFVYRTPLQTRGGILMVGGHTLIKARKGGLYIAVEEAIGDGEQSSYNDGLGGTRTVTFNDVRRYTFGLMAFPWSGPISPFIGVGGGIMHVVSPQSGGGDDPVANELGSTGFGALMGGLNFRVGGLSAFGHYQIQTVPGYKSAGAAEGRLISGTVHSLTGGLRISLGPAREEW